ncbi:hypothetical protein BCR35DRAFT_108658 [Leucosporidium creatinivorum]|uniref:Uncharacterized protein n=1 Tax=Leucosporidium creatinivorum TaxID=106004 RepID=A0A1Y2G3H0_9BASI|nr:hypothetical protein BCR35DRAFT_108658 [Leucosporidium creatinivorum]
MAPSSRPTTFVDFSPTSPRVPSPRRGAVTAAVTSLLVHGSPTSPNVSLSSPPSSTRATSVDPRRLSDSFSILTDSSPPRVKLSPTPPPRRSSSSAFRSTSRRRAAQDRSSSKVSRSSEHPGRPQSSSSTTVPRFASAPRRSRGCARTRRSRVVRERTRSKFPVGSTRRGPTHSSRSSSMRERSSRAPSLNARWLS